MLSIASQILVAEHLRLISECELEVELIREVLSEQQNFEPSIAFIAITRSKNMKNGILVENLKDFLTSNSTEFKLKEIQRLVHCYDSNGDLCLSFSDFLNFILPSNSSALRGITPSSNSLSPLGFLSHELTWALLRVFERELLNNRKIKASLKQLISRYDFSIADAFTSIDIQGLGYIDADSIFNFFVKNGLKISDNEILFIFRRFDKDQDGKITLREFENELNMLGINRVPDKMRLTGMKTPKKGGSKENSAAKPLKFKNSASSAKKTKREEIEGKNGQKYLENSIRSIKDSLIKTNVEEDHHERPRDSSDSPERVSVSKRRLYANYQFNQEDPDQKLESTSPIKDLEEKIHRQEILNSSRGKNLNYYEGTSSPEKSRFSEKKQGMGISEKKLEFSEKKLGASIMEPGSGQKEINRFTFADSDEKELVRTLKMQIELDREVERLRNELALQSDFTLLEAFRQFDIKGNGKIALYEIGRGFQALGIIIKEGDCWILIKKFAKNEENVIKYSDFCDIFTPRAEEFSHALSSRTGARIEDFTDYTKKLIGKIALQIIETEKTCDFLRKKLADRPNFTIQDAFTVLDRDQNGYISIDEFRAILNDYEIIPTTSDLINLMKRYDRNRDGKVSFTEFLNEMTPKKLF